MPAEIKGREQQGSRWGRADRGSGLPGCRGEFARYVEVSFGFWRAVPGSVLAGSLVIRNQEVGGGKTSDGATRGRMAVFGRFGGTASPPPAFHWPIPASAPSRHTCPR